jgi:hypothetical protein
LLNNYKAIAGRKECLKCITLIEKVEGCNYIECSVCHRHICWECANVISCLGEVYEHINETHKANGLVEEEDYSESEFDRDEEVKYGMENV